MFKKIILISAVLAFAVGVLFTSVWKTSAQTFQESEIFGREEVATAEGEGKVSELAEKEVDYQLAWPGILPDHFLYPIKMIRDRIWLWLTTDPVKRAELLLQLADKRIWSAQMLVEKGEVNLGVTTTTKAEKYLERAVNQEEISRRKGRETGVFLERLVKAAQKHEEVLLEMRGEVEEPARPIIDLSLGYARRAYEQARKRLVE